jgi:hypothetical protein
MRVGEELERGRDLITASQDLPKISSSRIDTPFKWVLKLSVPSQHTHAHTHWHAERFGQSNGALQSVRLSLYDRLAQRMLLCDGEIRSSRTRLLSMF